MLYIIILAALITNHESTSGTGAIKRSLPISNCTTSLHSLQPVGCFMLLLCSSINGSLKIETMCVNCVCQCANSVVSQPCGVRRERSWCGESWVQLLEHSLCACCSTTLDTLCASAPSNKFWVIKTHIYSIPHPILATEHYTIQKQGTELFWMKMSQLEWFL